MILQSTSAAQPLMLTIQKVRNKVHTNNYISLPTALSLRILSTLITNSTRKKGRNTSKKKNTHNTIRSVEQYLQWTRENIDKVKSDIALNQQQPDYTNIVSKKIKKAINENKFDSQKFRNLVGNADFKVNATYKKRRINAMSKYIPMYASLLKRKYPDVNVERVIIDMHSAPTTSLPDSNFIKDGKHYARPTTTAVALFILDELLCNNTIWEAMLYLPPYEEVTDTSWDETFSDATFPNDVIFSLAHLIENRDNTSGVFLTQATVNRTYEPVNNTEFTPSEITEEMYANNDEKVVAIRSKALQMSYRDRLDKILSLIPPTTIRRVIKTFKHKLYKFIDIALFCTKGYDVEYLKTLSDMESAFTTMMMAEKNMNETIQKTEAVLSLRSKIDPNLVLMLGATDMSKKDFASGFDVLDKYASKVASERRLWDQCTSNANAARQRLMDINDKYRSTLYMLINGHNHDFTYDHNQKMIDKIDTLGIDNPYEIIFAYFYLADKGHDIVWLVESAAAIVDIAIGKLPWGICDSKLAAATDEITADSEDSNKTISVKTRDADATSYLYDRRYNDYACWAAKDIPNARQEDLVSINLAQLTYSFSGIVPTRTSVEWSDEDKQSFVRTGINKNDLPFVQTMFDTNISLGQKNRFHMFGNKNTTICNKTIAELRTSLSEKTAKIDELTASLHAANKAAKEEKQKADRIREDTECEHNELVELRELIYKMQNETADESYSESSKPDISLPYAPKRNIVILGGHATWLKAVKPLLPTVKFIPPDVNPDAKLIRNADVVWMQTNAMPHSFYNKIMDIVRINKIPVKYFAYASAEKCAYQLAETDSNL